MSDQPAKHGHQHGPDGPDPIPVVASDRKWATATMFSTSVAKDSSGSYYYASFTDMGTNDTDVYTLESADWGTALGINEGGVYQAWFGMHKAGDGWGSDGAELQPIWEQSGSDAQLNSATDGFADFEQTHYSFASEIISSYQPASGPTIPTMFCFMTLHYDPPDPADGLYGFEVPFKLGVRVKTLQTGSLDLLGQIHVARIAAAGYTHVEA